MPLAKTLIKRDFPRVRKIVDATETLNITVLPQDAATGRQKDPEGCALVKACIRQKLADAAIIGLGFSYLIKGDTATRYKTSAAVGREITTFDRHKDFAPGVNYKLSRVSPGSKLGKRADFKTTNGPHKTTREPVARVHKGPVYASAPVKPKGTNHLTSDVRVMRSKSPALA